MRRLPFFGPNRRSALRLDEKRSKYERTIVQVFYLMPPDQITKREKASAARKSAILEAAVMCFIESGYHQTGVRDIAQRAGVSLGNLYNHFRGKTDVLAEIATIERAELRTFLDALGEDAPALDVLKAFVPAYTRHLAKPETIILALEITSEAIRQADIADLFTDSRTALIQAIADLLQRGAQEGSMRSMHNPTETAYLILEIMEGTAFRHGIEAVSLGRLLKNQWEFIEASVAVR